MRQVPVTMVNSREQLALEVNGRVLVLHFQGWSKRTQVYVPVECMRIGHGWRRRGKYAALALLIPVIGFIVSLLMGPAASAFAERGGAPAIEAARLMMGTMALGMTPAILLSMYFLYLYARSRPTFYVEVEYEDEVERIEFWRKQGSKDQARLIAKLEALEAAGAEGERYPLKMGYTWNHMRPLRSVVVWALTWMLPIYFLFLAAGYVAGLIAGGNLQPSWWLVAGVFASPWLWAFGLYGLEYLRLLYEPDSFRRGLSHYNKADFQNAEADLRETVEEHPEHLPSLYLLVDICLQRFDFDGALGFCSRLSDEDPELAESLQESIWALRRLRERMI